MKALVIGSGGREHALAWKLAQSPAVSATYTAPGNYGSNVVGANVNIPVTEPEALANWALENHIDLTVVGPETALAYGVVDVFREKGLRAFGPTRAAAQLETSKAWAKAFMERHGIPTAPYRDFDNVDDAVRYLESLEQADYPVVVKADGLAAGKGVTIAADRHSAVAAARAALAPVRRGAQPRIIIEGFLEGSEVSFMAISDGNTVWPLSPARDYKYAFDGDTGPMTGGMGAYSPVASVDQALTDEIMDTLIKPTIAGMAAEHIPYQGVLYAGLMLTSSGPKVLEFNARFGDPETQVLLPRLDSDLYIVIDAALDGQLSELPPLRWSSDVTCGIVLCSEGYPGEIETGYGVLGLADVGSSSLVFHNGTRDPYVKGDELESPKLERTAKGGMMRGQGLGSWFLPSRSRSKSADKQAIRISRDPYSQIVTSGGRVLTVVGRGPTLSDARDAAYRAAEVISFTGAWCRTDIGAADLLEQAR
ncbi:MAG: phosphoribosylamine--glycine ligase [Chloroflexi bacterium]|nr:phosphoribosylamine--glycine ligase [Chloroflexota bacterium]